MHIRDKRTFSCFPWSRAAIMLFFIGCFGPESAAGIKEIGLPFINNYPKTLYNASNQNWSVTQCSKGFMYFGNNDGLLEFDGHSWQLFPLPNNSIPRSVLAVGETIYAGAFEEIGYFERGTHGGMEYHSLTHLIPMAFRSFDEVWRIHQTSREVIFQSYRSAFIYDGNRIRVLEPPTDFSLSYLVRDRLYIIDRERGLMGLTGQVLEPLSNDPVFSRNEIRGILPFNNGRIIIGTNNEGLFLFDGKELTPWDIPLNQFLRRYNLFSALQLSNGYYVFGTVQNGVYIASPDGAVVQHINRFRGLQNNTVLGLFEDSRHNLWLGLDNGIDFIELNSPISLLDHNFGLESTYASIVFEGKLFAGTNQGLYVMDLDKLDAPDLPAKSFELVPGTEGQVWNLQEVNGELFCAHNFGAFLVNGKTARKLSDQSGYWYFIPHKGSADTIVAGTYNGLSWFSREQGQWQYQGELGGFSESSRSMLQDHDGSIWISHGYRGLFRVTPSRDLQVVEAVKLFGPAENLPAELPYNLQWLNNELVVTTRSGVFRFDQASNAFRRHSLWENVFRQADFLDKLHQDQAGNIWYFTNTAMGVYRLLENGTYQDIHTPFQRINSMLLPAFESILIMDHQNVFIGSQNGLIHYDASVIKDQGIPEPVYIREVVFQGKDGHMVMSDPEQETETGAAARLDIPHASNSVIFRYASPSFEETGRFAYRLLGFEENWSPWESVNFKEYTNLREGDYVFQVKALNAYHTESPPASFSFTVKPPLHRSTFAYIIYSLLLIFLIAGNIIYWRRRMRRTSQHERSRHQLNLQQQQLAFREESLKSAMGHKTRELANTTMHLIQKNKVLTSIRDQLSELVRTSKDEEERYRVQGLIKKINRDLKNEKHREVFDDYFDEVHQDFVARLRERYPDLSPKELRLCAYLRMNLSTKEIAPLMNISVRGVEISRYRLRKKLLLPREENLLDFILGF
jgi:ligand-binding sensor domain-containing protein/DNA-binding CsgD family transcriptional regulator